MVPASKHNFTCDGYLQRLAMVLDFSPTAEWIVYVEPDNRMLGPLRRVHSGEMFQFGNVENPFPMELRDALTPGPSFPKGYATAGGTYMRRSALEKVMKKLPERNDIEKKYAGKYQEYFSTDTCLYMLAGLAEIDLRGSQDVMQSTETCNEGERGALWPCYSCIHTCKRQASCYQSMSFASFPSWSHRLLTKAYLSVAQPLCWITSEQCSCPSAAAADEASSCIQSCSAVCPAFLHNLKGKSGTFIDCHSYDAADDLEEL
eukprot:TRINITY_DN25085_c0_g1_i1.p1 TRINITY_DN25085_c0_g1~~TRINITY_DN25085_c0_g1_i1.p1  ORF type:complete len:272 (-),score=21.53 TRINITY_DN25085_c0_g1_i1:93-872(-)